MSGGNNGVPRRKAVPMPQQAGSHLEPLSDDWAKELTERFRRTLSTKRMNELSSRSRRYPRIPNEIIVSEASQAPPPLPARNEDNPFSQAPPLPSKAPLSPPTQEQIAAQMPPPPAYSLLRNLPNVPTPPTDNKSLRFRHLLITLSNTPCKWENPGLLDEALSVIPLERIYEEAQDEANLFAAEAASLGDHILPAWGYQDCVIRALMKWFKRDYFEWVNNPKCSTCRSPTIARGRAAPLPDEAARGANRVELYQCAHAQCQSFERFPRYNDAFVLLQTRRGRVGEWANCFSMLCRAVGSRVRWVWNMEDHVWTEVYSVHRKRWVHVDCCEEAWDAPLLYTQGWRKKLSYCIAFSADGCSDVTRRYARSPTDHALPRTKCPEGVLLHILREINALRRNDTDKKSKHALLTEDMREDAEMRRYMIEALAFNVSRILPGGCSSKDKGRTEGRSDPDAQKAAEGRDVGEGNSAVRQREGSTPGQGQSQQSHRAPPPPPPRDPWQH